MVKKKKSKPELKYDTGFESKDQAGELGYVAACIERISDGRLLFLNSDLETYSFKDNRIENYVPHKYTYDSLLNDSRCIGAFKVISWVKDFNAEKFIKFLNK